MAGAPRTGFARESLIWGFAKWFAASGIDSRDSARFDATFRHISAIDPRNPLHSGTSVPVPARLGGRRAMRQARYAAAALPDVRRRPVTWRPICRCAPVCLTRKVHRGPHETSCGAGMRTGVIQLRSASTKVYWVRICSLILKAPCRLVRGAGRFQRYERGRERRRTYGRLVPQLTQKLPSFSVPHAGQCQVRLGVNAGGTGGAGACCCAAAAGASGAGAGV